MEAHLTGSMYWYYVCSSWLGLVRLPDSVRIGHTPSSKEAGHHVPSWYWGNPGEEHVFPHTKLGQEFSRSKLD